MSTYQTTVDRKDGRIECTVTFTEEQFAPAEKAAMEHLGKNVKMEGFRPGHVPADMLREKLDPGQILEEAVRQLLPPVFAELAKENDIKPIVPPHVEALDRTPLKVKIVFIEKPEVKVKNPDKIKVEKKEPKVDDKEVQRMVDYVLKQHEKRRTVDRAAKEGDAVVMDFRGVDKDGKEIEAIKSENYNVVLGSKTLLPGFEDNLLGLKKDDEKSFELIFPDKYHAEEFRNKPVTFHVKVKAVEEVEAPELTDEFAKQQLNAESADAFRSQVRESMAKQEEQIEDQRREQALLEEIRKATDVKLPKELVDEELKQLIEDLQKQLSQQSLTLNDWLSQQNKKPDELEKELRERAEHRLIVRLALQHLIEVKEIKLDEAQMKAEIDQTLSALDEERRAKLQPLYQPGERLYDQLRWQKQVETLVTQMLAA